MPSRSSSGYAADAVRALDMLLSDSYGGGVEEWNIVSILRDARREILEEVERTQPHTDGGLRSQEAGKL